MLFYKFEVIMVHDIFMSAQDHEVQNAYVSNVDFLYCPLCDRLKKEIKKTFSTWSRKCF